MDLTNQILTRFSSQNLIQKEFLDSLVLVDQNFRNTNKNWEDKDIEFVPYSEFIIKFVEEYLQKLRAFNYSYLDKIKKLTVPESSSSNKN